MPPKKMTDAQIKALILNYLTRRRRWGNRYNNRQKIVRYLGHDVLDNGKEVSRCLNELANIRWLNIKKKGETVSLNTRQKKEIWNHIENHLDR